MFGFSLHGVHRVRHGKISCMDFLVWDAGMLIGIKNTSGMTMTRTKPHATRLDTSPPDQVCVLLRLEPTCDRMDSAKDEFRWLDESQRDGRFEPCLAARLLCVSTEHLAVDRDTQIEQCDEPLQRANICVQLCTVRIVNLALQVFT